MFDRMRLVIRALAVLTMIVAAPIGCTRWSPEREAKALEQGPTLRRIQMVRSTAWRVTSLQDERVPQESLITLQLAPDDKVAGSAGVNRYTGSYDLDAPDQLSFSDVVTTKMAGPPEAMAREQTFLNLLDRVRSFRLRDEGGPQQMLELRDAADKVLMEARAS